MEERSKGTTVPASGCECAIECPHSDAHCRSLGAYPTNLPEDRASFLWGGFNIFLLRRQFFRTIPQELADAACSDGRNAFAIYAHVMVPLTEPVLVTVAILTFLGTWNDFMEPLLYIDSPQRFTLAIGLANFRGTWFSRTRWDLVMAFATAMTLPVVLVFFLAQRYFVQGVVLSGLKG